MSRISDCIEQVCGCCTMGRFVFSDVYGESVISSLMDQISKCPCKVDSGECMTVDVSGKFEMSCGTHGTLCLKRAGCE
jgi:hypothetical protein